MTVSFRTQVLLSLDPSHIKTSPAKQATSEMLDKGMRRLSHAYKAFNKRENYSTWLKLRCLSDFSAGGAGPSETVGSGGGIELIYKLRE